MYVFTSVTAGTGNAKSTRPCVCIDICVYICIYVRMHECMYVRMYVFTRVSAGAGNANFYYALTLAYGIAQVYVAGCCRVLQDVAGCCRVLQGVAGCCRVLQGVATAPLVFCTVLQ